MSTILDALKRLEEDTKSREASQVALPLRGQPRAPRRNAGRYLILFVILATLAGGAVVYWFAAFPPQKSPSPGTADPQLPQVADVPSRPVLAPSPSKSSADATSPVRRDAGGRDEPPPPRKESEPSRSAKSTITSQRYVPPDMEAPRRRVAPAVALVDGKADTPRSRGENAAREVAANPAAASSVDLAPNPDKPSAPLDSHADTEVLTQDSMKLQAISWSEIPTARITVIAGRILKEGQNIEGYTVVEIRSSDVIVEKSGKRWKLVYNAR